MTNTSFPCTYLRLEARRRFVCNCSPGRETLCGSPDNVLRWWRKNLTFTVFKCQLNYCVFIKWSQCPDDKLLNQHPVWNSGQVKRSQAHGAQLSSRWSPTVIWKQGNNHRNVWGARCFAEDECLPTAEMQYPLLPESPSELPTSPPLVQWMYIKEKSGVTYCTQ